MLEVNASQLLNTLHIVGQAIEGFQLSGSALRHAGDRNALWFFLIAITSALAIMIRDFTFVRAAGDLTAKLRSLSFKALLRQDSTLPSRSSRWGSN